MRAARLYGPGDIRIEDLPEPEPGPGEVKVRVTGSAGADPAHNTRALELIASGVVQVSDLITHRFPLGRLHEAIDVAASGRGMKVVIEP